MNSDFLTQGPHVEEFEYQMASYLNCDSCVAVNSATSGLHLACLAAGLDDKSRVWTTPLSFVATANCARYVGAEVSFIDIDRETLNISPLILEQKLKSAKQNGTLPDAIIIVHFGGVPCDLEKIYSLKKQYKFILIEDASHALGAEYKGKKIGCCDVPEFTIFSLHPVKIITAGEGGVVACKSNYERVLKSLRSHGITKRSQDPRPWFYEQSRLGFNYRLTDIQAALGSSQLKKLDRYVEKRNQLTTKYNARFADNKNVETRSEQRTLLSAQHLYVVQFKKIVTDSSRGRLMKELHALGIQTQVHYIPIYWQPYYRSLGYNFGLCPNAERYYTRCLSLPLHPAMNETDVDYIADKVLENI